MNGKESASYEAGDETAAIHGFFFNLLTFIGYGGDDDESMA